MIKNIYIILLFFLLSGCALIPPVNIVEDTTENPIFTIDNKHHVLVLSVEKENPYDFATGIQVQVAGKFQSYYLNQKKKNLLLLTIPSNPKHSSVKINFFTCKPDPVVCNGYVFPTIANTKLKVNLDEKTKSLYLGRFSMKIGDAYPHRKSKEHPIVSSEKLTNESKDDLSAMRKKWDIDSSRKFNYIDLAAGDMRP